MGLRNTFKKLCGAKVEIKSITDLKVALATNVHSVQGLPVERFRIEDGDVYVRVTAPTGAGIWLWFGTLEDVAFDAQRGRFGPPWEKTEGR